MGIEAVIHKVDKIGRDVGVFERAQIVASFLGRDFGVAMVVTKSRWSDRKQNDLLTRVLSANWCNQSQQFARVPGVPSTVWLAEKGIQHVELCLADKLDEVLSIDRKNFIER